MMRTLAPVFLSILLLMTSGCFASRQAAAPSTASDAGDIKSYSEVITSNAESDAGLFTVHWVDDKLYYEIPDTLLGRDMLLISRLSQVPSGLGAYLNAGRKVAERVIRWQRVDERLLLQPVSYASVAPDSLPIAKSVRVNSFEPILASFDIAALGKDSASVIVEVTKLFSESVPALSGLSSNAQEEWGISTLDDDRSFINYAHSYPENVDVRHTLTYRATKGPAESIGAISLELHQSMVLLPNRQMAPRACDVRVGYFDVERINYASDELKAAEECFISRWRLEPSDVDAYRRGELVEPVKPIVFYLDPAIPERWIPYVRKGIEDWDRAFEAAGFENAVRVEEAPSEEENPNWNPEDVRYSTVRWAASTTRNAMGPSVVDPRSGEIIESDIIWYHNHLRSYRNRLIIETSAANPRARTLDLPEDLIGETMRQVIAHEVGHAVGLPHNMIASSAYPVDSLRSPAFTEKYGVAASIMDYARQNYIAQPGDGVRRFIRKIGPYDLYAIDWGYRRFPGLSEEEQERRLDEMILAHAGNPRYRFLSWPYSQYDPRAQTEDLGGDPVEASRLAVANLQRVVPALVDRTTTEGKDFETLEEIYGELLGMWRRYMGHVVGVVGGTYAEPKMSGQEGVVYTPVPRGEQERAVDFLADHVFTPPRWLFRPDILQRIEPAGTIKHMWELQVGILEQLLDSDRLIRLSESEAMYPSEAYPVPSLLEDVRGAVWHEIQADSPEIGLYRRHLQRGYLQIMEELLNDEGLSPTAIWPNVRSQLTSLREEVRLAILRTDDTTTQVHLEDVAARLDKALDEEE